MSILAKIRPTGATIAAIAVLLPLLALAPRQAAAQRPATRAAITPEDLRHRLFLIADDSMAGRESGSRGNAMTADYVAAEFKRLGLAPAGDNGTYFQVVPFWRASADPTSRINASGTTMLRLGADFLPINTAPTKTFTDARVIFGGPAADSTKWISVDSAANRLVILDVPGGAYPRGLPPLARWRGALAVAIVALDATGPEYVARYVDGRPVTDTTRDPRGILRVMISRRAATQLLAADPSTLAAGALGATVSGTIGMRFTPVESPARNVVAVLKGSDPKLRGQYVALTAHNDHVGYDHSPVDHDSIRAVDRITRPMGADSPSRPPTAAEWTRIRPILDSLRKVNKPRLDSIRNGADDDGSGTVAILEIAEAMALGRVKPKRSILFVNHTGEEDGLVGSAWYTDHPTVPLDSVVAEIDEDMTGRGRTDDQPYPDGRFATPTYLEVIGAKRLSREFGDTLEAVNARQPTPFVFNYAYDVPGHPLQYYCRADHYNYARYGIPAVALSRGEHLDYHQVTDEAQYISYPDLARVTKLVFDAAIAIAAMPMRPALSSPKPVDPHGQCRQ